MKKRNLLFTILFLIVIVASIGYLNKVFTNDQKVMKEFYKQSENSLDGIYLGTSAAYDYWMPTRAFETKGMCIYNLASSARPFVLEKYVIKEALKSQDEMKVIVIELRGLLKDPATYKTGYIRLITDSMHFSVNRSEAIEASIKYYDDMGVSYKDDRLSFHFPVAYYHDKLKDGIGTDAWLLKEPHKPYMGFGGAKGLKIEPFEKPKIYTDERDLGDPQEAALIDLLDYCKTLKQQVIFVASPFVKEKADYEKINKACRICEENGFTVLNFNQESLRSELNLDYSTEFHDKGHVNFDGSIKYTDFLSDYLTKHIDFSDHRKEDGYEKWTDETSSMNELINKKRKER